MSTELSPAGLTKEDLRRYQADGYLVIRNLFTTEEIAALESEAKDLIEREELIDTGNIRCRWQNHIETGECLFECFDPVIDLGSVCERVARDPRIIETLSAIYGEQACLFKDKLIFKPPGAKGYSLHQDYIGWKNFPKSFITVLVAIDAADPQNGATEVFPGCHHDGYLSPEDGMYHDLPLETINESKGVMLDLQPGDIGIFGCFTPHRSSPNRTSGWRRQLYLSYNALSDGGERRDIHYREFHAWLVERYAEYGKVGVWFK